MAEKPTSRVPSRVRLEREHEGPNTQLQQAGSATFEREIGQEQMEGLASPCPYNGYMQELGYEPSPDPVRQEQSSGDCAKNPGNKKCTA